MEKLFRYRFLNRECGNHEEKRGGREGELRRKLNPWCNLAQRAKTTAAPIPTKRVAPTPNLTAPLSSPELEEPPELAPFKSDAAAEAEEMMAAAL